jgi:hypothetical protein
MSSSVFPIAAHAAGWGARPPIRTRATRSGAVAGYKVTTGHTRTFVAIDIWLEIGGAVAYFRTALVGIIPG